jgi:PAS domain S-box-containing protein
MLTGQNSQASSLLDLYAALLACDRAIIRCTDKAHMFEEVCRCLVEPGGMELAWIGMLDASDQRVWPQAHAGKNWAYLDWVRLISCLEKMPDQGMVGAAIATGQVVWSEHVSDDPQMAGLKDFASARQWRCAISIPLTVDQQAAGVLCLYSQSAHAFDEKARYLLSQLASNISTALDALELNEQRRQAEFALQESEVRYNALFASNSMPMLVIDPVSSRIVDANIRAMNFYGWDYATITSKTVNDINVLSPHEIREEMARAVSAQRTYLDFKHRLASGELRDVEVFSSPLNFNGQTHLVSVIHDVTERRRLEAQVQQSQSLMQRFIDQLPGTAFVKDQDLKLVMANQRLGALLGADPKSLIGKTAQEIFPAEFADFVTQLDQEVMQAGDSRTFYETYQERHNETSMFVINDGTGRKFLGGLSFDVTDRFRAKERTNALLQINELGGQLAEKDFLTAGLELAEKLTSSKIGFLHFVNEDQETLELVTWTAGALKGCTAGYDNHYPVSQAGIWADCLRQGKPAVFNDYEAYPAKHGLPQGHAVMTRLISVPVIEGGKVRMMMGVGNKPTDYEDFDVETLLLVGNDLWRIARRTRVEASLQHRVSDLEVANKKLSEMQLQLLQSEKMASIGQLASGVAHEINNPIGFVKSNLGSLSGYVDSLVEIVRSYEATEHIQGEELAVALQSIARRKQTLDYDFLIEDVRKLIVESSEGVQRISQIVLDLKNFSRSGDVTMAAADLQAGIESTINVVWNQLKYKVNVVREYAELPPVLCVASQINQVAMNLLVNAGQAIQEHGTITIRTGRDAENVWFEVQDTGCGIPSENLARIFEPFFTSKPVGQGTGLGLSISFGIVQRHGGSITVKSEVGVGSVFRVTLPLVTGDAAE